MVILTKRCWFRGYFREAQSLVVILAKSFGFVAKIAKISSVGCGVGGGLQMQNSAHFYHKRISMDPANLRRALSCC